MYIKRGLGSFNFHCRYRGPDEWMRLNGERFTVSDAVPRKRTMPTLEELAEWSSADG